jgi:hypothetical protein
VLKTDVCRLRNGLSIALADHGLTINESCNGRRDAKGKSMQAMELAGTQEDGWRKIAIALTDRSIGVLSGIACHNIPD